LLNGGDHSERNRVEAQRATSPEGQPMAKLETIPRGTKGPRRGAFKKKKGQGGASSVTTKSLAEEKGKGREGQAELTSIKLKRRGNRRKGNTVYDKEMIGIRGGKVLKEKGKGAASSLFISRAGGGGDPLTSSNHVGRSRKIQEGDAQACKSSP